MNDQTPSKESVEQENKIADENVDLDEGTTSPLNEDGGEYAQWAPNQKYNTNHPTEE